MEWNKLPIDWSLSWKCTDTRTNTLYRIVRQIVMLLLLSRTESIWRHFSLQCERLSHHWRSNWANPCSTTSSATCSRNSSERRNTQQICCGRKEINNRIYSSVERRLVHGVPPLLYIGGKQANFASFFLLFLHFDGKANGIPCVANDISNYYWWKHDGDASAQLILMRWKVCGRFYELQQREREAREREKKKKTILTFLMCPIWNVATRHIQSVGWISMVHTMPRECLHSISASIWRNFAKMEK